MLILYQKSVITINNFELLNFHIVNNAKYIFYFKNCLKILNNTYLLTHLLAIIAPLYHNQKE